MTDLLFRPYVEAALREDLRSGDITTEALIPTHLRGKAAMNFRVEGIVCGLPLAKIAFETLDSSAQINVLVEEGALVAAGSPVLSVEAAGRALLSAERVALNFVQRLSAIATLTAQFVAATEGTKAKIADTRKTTPGLRLLEKYAVRCGGGSNHRYALDDLILIKDNHIALCGGISQAVEKARERIGHAVKVEVECDTLEQVEEAVASGADILLLDNMGPEILRSAIEIIGGRAVAEASGGVNLDTVRAIAQSGVDLISVGALTHGVRSLDIGLDVEI
jgi:nicotinate-nucleotide pyrophosphorylase (carboxylating)